jgi:alpha-tubulin suppressor-like RCC1 family protein
MVVTPQGNLLAWGGNPYGVLGQGKGVLAFPSSSLPVQVLDPSGKAPLDHVVAASVGTINALAVTESGEVVSWGDSSQLGNDTVPNSTSLPVPVLNATGTSHLDHIVAVSQGDWNSLALADDGTVFAWGWGYTAGQGRALDVAKFPVQVKDPSGSGILQNIVAISAGSNFTLALGRDGRVFAWGKNDQGQLGNGTASTQTVFLPTVVQKASGGELTNIVSISAGDAHCMALAADGSVYVWGSDGNGQLGIDTRPGSSYKASAVQPLNPAGTGALSGMASIATGGNSSYAVDANGYVFAWGLATSGQLGDGPNRPTGNSISRPYPVVGNAGTGQLTAVVGVAAGYGHAMTLMPDGTVQIWGDGFAGNLGQGTASTTDSPVPLYVKDMAGTGKLNIAPLTTDRAAFMRFR